MPRVNIPSAPTVAADSSAFTERLSNASLSPEQAAAPFKQMQQFGQQVQEATGTMAKIQMDTLKTQNDLRVSDGLNRARQAALDAAYDKDKGYLNLKGLSALERPNGQSLVDEYGGEYDKQVGSIAASLGNDAQRQEFMLRANDLSTSFRGDLQKHMFTENVNYQQSVNDGTVKLAQQEAATFWNNPERISTAIEGTPDPVTGQRLGGLKQAIYNKGKLTGLSANETEAAMNDAVSNVHSTVVQSSLENGNVTYASKYFDENKKSMTAGDVLKVQGLVNSQMDAKTAMQAVNSAFSEQASAFTPSSFDRLVNVVSATESGMRDVDAKGNVITSPKGAKGRMQVLDSTNKDPGFGVTPAKDDSLEERARVGRDYLGALTKHYPDLGQALAAYNYGPGNFDKAKAEADKDKVSWMSKMPAETRNYVTKNLNDFQAGQGTPVLPTKLDMVNAATKKLGDDPRPEALKLARDTAEKQYDLMVDSRKQQAETALGAAQKELIANGGNFAALSPATVMALSQTDPDVYKKASEFAKVVNDPVSTNPEAYANAVLNIGEVASYPEATLTQYLRSNFDASDQKNILKMVQDYRSGSSDNSAASLNSAALNTALDGRLESIGIISKPTKGWFGKEDDYQAALAQVGGIQRFIRNDLYEQQKQVGRKFSPEEIEQRLDYVFSKNVELKGMLWNSQKKLLKLTTSDIPNADYASIKKTLAMRGISTPSDDMVLRMYQTKKLRENGTN